MRLLADSFIDGMGWLCFGLGMLLVALGLYAAATWSGAGRDIDEDRK